MYDPLTSKTIPAFHEAGMATYWQAVTPFSRHGFGGIACAS